MTVIRWLPLVALLAGCGVDGAPVPPREVDETPPPGLTITGSVTVGVGGTL